MRKYFALAVAAIVLGACREKDYYDAEYRDAAYKATWEHTFGEINPEQDWNMATRTNAVIDLTQENIYNGTVQIMTGNPSQETAYLLATTPLANGQATIAFDAVKGHPALYVRVMDGSNNTIYKTWTIIENGIATIGAKATRATRAASDITLGDKYVINSVRKRLTSSIDPTYTIEEARKVGDKNFWNFIEKKTDEWGNESYFFENIDGEKKETNQHNIPGMYGCSAPEYECSSLYPYRMIKTPSQTYQKLNGIENGNSMTWKVADYYYIFGKGGYFEEQRDPSCLERWKDQFEPNVTFTVSGELTLDYMFGGTEHTNVFGYYYWQDGEDPIEATRYVLIADAQPSSNLTYSTPDGENKWVYDETTGAGHNEFIPSGTYSNQGAVGNMALATWMVQSQNADALVTGTSYKVPYIDKDGNASYDFPNGTHIAFFLVVNGLNNQMNNWLGKTNMSVRDHNLEINRTFSGYSRNNSDPDPTKGEIDAISFKYGNQIYLGFEDRGGDKDMNDIVFFVNGNAQPEGNIVIVPEPGEEPEPEPEPIPWIIACEDLGGSYDFDFNDVVFSVGHAEGKTKAYITPLAAGGTLPAYITYNGEPLGEIHELFGEEYTGYMINTCAYENNGITHRAEPIEINVPADFSVTDNMGGLGILVKNRRSNMFAEDTYAVEAPSAGNSPQMILVPHTWRWPKERIRINLAYEGFAEWGQNYGNTTWYNNPISGYVIDR